MCRGVDLGEEATWILVNRGLIWVGWVIYLTLVYARIIVSLCIRVLRLGVVFLPRVSGVLIFWVSRISLLVYGAI
jgi:hypothetical protein